jgi:hypothetical protein
LWAREPSSPSSETKQRRHRELPTGEIRPHLPMVDGGDVEEHPRTSHSPRSVGEVAGVEHEHEHQNPRSSRDRFESERMKSRVIVG